MLPPGAGGRAFRVGSVLSIAAALVIACSTSGSNPGGGVDAGAIDGNCGPLPESLTVASFDDCVATIPNPCCSGLYGFDCDAADGGGPQCSETATCVRASRYDQSLCAGAMAYSCPDLNGINFATLPTPECEQMEGVGPTGEGIRWCCGSNLPPSTYDAAAPPVTDEDSATPPITPVDAASDAAVDTAAPAPKVDSGSDSGHDSGSESEDAGEDDASTG